MKSTHTPAIDTVEDPGKRVSADLEYAGYILLRASSALDKAIRILIENYPDLVLLADKLTIINGRHPYLRIMKAAYLYEYFRYRYIGLTN